MGTEALRGERGWGEAGAAQISVLLGAGAWGCEEPYPTSSLSSDAFDFNYGVCVMRMREGLNISEVMQAHSEYTPHVLSTPVKNQNRILESSRTQLFSSDGGTRGGNE